MVVEGVEVDAGGPAGENVARERGRVLDADLTAPLDGRLHVEGDRQVGGQRFAGQLDDTAQSAGSAGSGTR